MESAVSEEQEGELYNWQKEKMGLTLVCHAAVAAMREVWRGSVALGKERAFPLCLPASKTV